MAGVPNDRATHVLQMLCERADEVRQELQEQTVQPVFSGPDDDRDSSSPILDSFLTVQRSAAFQEMTNFSICKFQRIYDRFHDKILLTWNCGRG